MRGFPCIGILFIIFQLTEGQSFFDMLSALGVVGTRMASRDFHPMFGAANTLHQEPNFMLMNGGNMFGPLMPDPSLQNARISAAEEQMAEVLSETPRNNPEHQRISRLIQSSGGRFQGDAAPLNHLVEEYLMTTPGPTPPANTPSNNRQSASRRTQNSAGSFGPQRFRARARKVPINENMRPMQHPLNENRNHVIYTPNIAQPNSQNLIDSHQVSASVKPAKVIQRGNAQRPISSERLRSVETRIDSLSNELRYAQQTGSASQIQEAQSALESLYKVRDILTGASNRHLSRQITPGSSVSHQYEGPGSYENMQFHSNTRLETNSGTSNGNIRSSSSNGRLNRVGRRENSNQTPINNDQRLNSRVHYQSVPTISPMYDVSNGGTSNFQETNIGGTWAQTWDTHQQAITNHANGGMNNDPYAGTAESANAYRDQGVSYDTYAQTHDHPNSHGSAWQFNRRQQAADIRHHPNEHTDIGTYQDAQPLPANGYNILSSEQRSRPARVDPQNGPTTSAPVEGDVRYLANQKYVYSDVDGFDNFQWVKAPLSAGSSPGSGETQQQRAQA